MKKLTLTFFFTNYILFIPFVLINCGMLNPEDAPYDRLAEAEANPEPTADEVLIDCEERDYLSADCVTVLQEESDRVAAEQASVAAAAKATVDLVACPGQMAEAVIAAAEASVETAAEADAEASDEAVAVEETIDCGATLTDMAAALLLCEDPEANTDQADCDILDNVVTGQLFDCDALVEETFIYSETSCATAAPDATMEFCAAFTASLYELCHPTDATVSPAQGISCEVLDHIYSAVLCECNKEEPGLSDDVCSDVLGLQQATEEGVETTE
jgi:hypothetical protein